MSRLCDRYFILPKEWKEKHLEIEELKKIHPDITSLEILEKFLNETGLVYGLAGTYTYHYDKKLTITTDLEIAFGGLEYDGLVDGSSITADTDDWILEFRIIAGYSFLLNGRYQITPFIGNAYRHWSDDINHIQGYQRRIEY